MPRRPAVHVATITRATIAIGTVLLAAGCGRGGDGGDAAGSFPETREPFEPTAEMRMTAVATTDLEAMLDDLSRIEGWHARERTGLVPSLRGGVPVTELDAAEAALGCRFPDDLRALWRWRDGQADPDGTAAFAWYHALLPMHEALARYRELRAMPILGWEATWLPVLYFQEEWYFVECRPERVAASPLMFLFTESGPAPAYASLTTYFATMAEAMATGAVTHGDGGLDADEPALAAIHRRRKPGLPFPYFVADNAADVPGEPKR